MSYYLSSPIEFTLLISWLFVFTILSWRRLDFGIYLILLLLPTYLVRFEFWFPFFGLNGIPTTLLEAMIYILFLLWLKRMSPVSSLQSPVKRLLKLKTYIVYPKRYCLLPKSLMKEDAKKDNLKTILGSLWFPFALIFLGALISIFVTPHTFKSLGIFKAFFFDSLLFIIVLQSLLAKPRTFACALTALSLSGFAVSFIALGYFFSGNLTYDGRLRAFYESPNYLAMYLAPLLVFTVSSLWSTATTYGKLFWMVATASIVAALYLTYSHGAWFGVLGATLFLALFYAPFGAPHKRKVIISFLICVFLISVLLPIFATSSIGTALLDESPASSQSRFVIWKTALAILKDHPFWGIGLGTFQEYYLAYQSRFPEPYPEWAVPYPHNLFLAFWLQTGLIGFVGFLWVFIRSLQKMTHLSQNKNRTTFAAALVAIAVTILLHGAIDTPFWKNDLSVLFFTIVILLWQRQKVVAA